MNDQNPTPQAPMPPLPPKPPRKRGLEFKPWPLKDFLLNLFAMGMVFAVASFLPKGTIASSSLIGGTMAAMTLSYLNYCGYSLLTSPLRLKLAVAMIFFGVMILTGGVAELMLGKAA